MSLSTMQDLLVHELRDLMSAEKQLLKALPKMAKAANNARLAGAIREHLEQTKDHVDRLEDCFELLETSSRGKKCKGMAGLIEEGNDATDEPEDDDIRDAAIIGAAQRVEHYEMAAYGTARAFAEQLGLDKVVALLSASLEEEASANERLTKLAEQDVNPRAGANGHASVEVEGATKRKGSKAKAGRKSDRSSRQSALH